MLNFKKNIVVGVAITPEIGLEVAQIDYATKTVLKYGYKNLNYDNNRKEISDMDIFKESLQELFAQLEIPKGSDVILSIPPAVFNVVDYPASLTFDQVKSVIEEDLLELPMFHDMEANVAIAKAPNSTIQSSKYVYAAAPKVMLIEIVMQLDDLGYNLITIDTSPNSALNALIYNERLNVAQDSTWIMLQVENFTCRIFSMQGKSYVDAFEEKISIGEVLGDAENYATVVSAVQPILKNLPAQYLYVVSKTNVISAEVLASKLVFNAPIIHQEANVFNKETFLEVASDVDEADAKLMTLDVIGAAINREFSPNSEFHLNLFNEGLGEVYLSKQPPVVVINGKSIVLSIENMIRYSVAIAVPAILLFAGINYYLQSEITKAQTSVSKIESEIADVQKFLKDNEDISTELFDEGDEIRVGLAHNKNIYTYYTIVGTEIPQKLWLTSLKLGEHIEIEGQASNLESVYSFYKNIKDYDPSSPIKLQKLGLASKLKMQELTDEGEVSTETLLSSMNADFYSFRISDTAEPVEENSKVNEEEGDGSTPPKNGIK